VTGLEARVDAVTAALKQAEVFGLGHGSLSPVSRWWVTPIDGRASLESICGSSVASKRLEQGLIEASRAYRNHPELIARYFRFACTCVSDSPRVRDFQSPIWLDWIEQTADALRVWHDSISAMPHEQMRAEFRETSWAAGISHIRLGRPRVAKRRWAEDVQRIVDVAGAKLAAMREAERDLRLAAELAARIGVEGPPVSDVLVNTDETRASLDRWWGDIGDPALAHLFWNAQLPFLQRVRHHPARPLSTSEKRALTQLIDSATRAERPSFNEIHKLSLTHAAVLLEVMASTGNIGVRKEVVDGQVSLLFD
jgi:hypothetical protein